MNTYRLTKYIEAESLSDALLSEHEVEPEALELVEKNEPRTAIGFVHNSARQKKQ